MGGEGEDGVVVVASELEESVVYVCFDGVSMGTVGIGETNVEELVV